MPPKRGNASMFSVDCTKSDGLPGVSVLLLPKPRTGRNQGSAGDRGVPATACGGCDCTGWVRGLGRGRRFFRLAVPGRGLEGDFTNGPGIDEDAEGFFGDALHG